MSKEWKISDSQKQHFTTNLVAGEIQEDQLKDGQTSEHRNRLNRKSQKKKKKKKKKLLRTDTTRYIQTVGDRLFLSYRNYFHKGKLIIRTLSYIRRVAQEVWCLTTDWTIGVRSSAGQMIFPLTSVSRPALGPTQPPVQWVPGVLSPGRDADHSPPSSDEVVNE
jgi:hypothetical protein